MQRPGTDGTFDASRCAARAGLLAMAMGAVTAPVALAVDDSPPVSADDVRELVDEVHRQRGEIESLRGEVAQLRAEEGAQWLTEQRAAEIRALVSDVLADSDTRSSLMQGGLTAGWDKSFFLASEDGKFLLQMDGQIQLRWVGNYVNNEDNYVGGFENTRTKLTFRGHVVDPSWTYLVRMDVTRNEPELVTGLFFLQDAWVRYELTDDMSVRFGQFKLPFNREELVSSAHQLAVERSLFNENTNLGRSQGIEFAFNGHDWRISGMLSDGAVDNLGGFDLIEPGGTPLNTNALEGDSDISFTGRAEWKLAGTWEQFVDLTSPSGEPFGAMLGGAFHYQKGEHGGTDFGPTEEEWLAYTVDASIEFGGANLFAAWTQHLVDVVGFNSNPPFDLDSHGLVVQGGLFLTQTCEVFARFEWGQFIPHLQDTAFKTLQVGTIGVNFYVDGHDVKWTIDGGYAIETVDASWDSDLAGWRSESSENPGQMVARVQLQLLF